MIDNLPPEINGPCEAGYRTDSEEEPYGDNSDEDRDYVPSNDESTDDQSGDEMTNGNANRINIIQNQEVERTKEKTSGKFS